ncbi:helix-turn-helix domain-containing protein [Bifidobacterium cuniculi]|uniref:DNA-binding helix-turn-helix protein n=1 Tax=Bifidobacterium cuniculi TaxID=1688 RepID=A0A087AWT7_9BIFI|nr:helix-turn-helix transcriptional regulator [Bifidobacterium cuniculi]KFI63237.1 DNA-binding helix-turn-helix protein [Bifidobacterium cuniculi]
MTGHTLTLGKRIRKLMTEQGRTQKQIAELVDITEATMSRYVNDERMPSADILADIATALHTNSDALLGRTRDTNLSLPEAVTLVARNASYLTNEQKRAVITALLGIEHQQAEQEEGSKHEP